MLHSAWLFLSGKFTGLGYCQLLDTGGMMASCLGEQRVPTQWHQLSQLAQEFACQAIDAAAAPCCFPLNEQCTLPTMKVKLPEARQFARLCAQTAFA